ncbi:ice-binding family protein [Conexibacter woesei]|uniref:DUF3494 domain-containing protein n=1 Tax=Conexibacter woesei (strain DSM 14684 / CCUG 47730 / CIP 108061 / JCM 11494 / NBRC 100937 / ID131577) TaxID=469383 RepID=D3FDU5_CONWI|nr:ice-binding family protein [Conexibacter woesei]ADB51561.1 hypothetical protein Cwoe_3142 [Conexibacter woesei DSM 14684]
MATAPRTTCDPFAGISLSARRVAGAFAVALLVVLTSLTSAALAAQPPVGLGTADSFAVLSGSTVTNIGPSTINGNLGVSPGTAVIGFPPGTVNGTIHAADAVAGQAQSDLTTAYDDAAGRTPPAAVPADLTGHTLTPGVYRSASALALTGQLTLDAQGDPSAVFVFQAGSTLITGSGSHVSLVNGAQPCNVFWQVGSSATLGTTSVFAGNILALTSITLTDGVTLHGRALARNGAVTLINDTITAARCATGGGTPGGGTPGGGGGGSGGGGTGGGGGTQGGGPGGGNGTNAAPNGRGALTTTPSRVARYGTTRCVQRTFRALVTGRSIRRVVFTVDRLVVTTARRAPFAAMIEPGDGISTLKARVTFNDGTPAVTRRMRMRACAAARRPVAAPQRPSTPPSRPPRTPGGFTG